jgi:hypothetical protein
MSRDFSRSAKTFQPNISPTEAAQLKTFSKKLEDDAEMNKLREAIQKEKEAKYSSQLVLLPRAAPQSTQMQTLRSFQPPVYAADPEYSVEDAEMWGERPSSNLSQSQGMNLTFAERVLAKRAAVIAAEAAADRAVSQGAEAAADRAVSQGAEAANERMGAVASDSGRVLPLPPLDDVTRIISEIPASISLPTHTSEIATPQQPPVVSKKGWFAKLFDSKEGGKHTHYRRKKSKNALSRKNCKKRYSVKAKRRNRRKSRR